MNNSFSIGIFVLSWNEKVMLPHFLSHYLPIATSIEIYDNGSTDDSILTATSNLSEENKKKVLVHDISYARGYHALHKVQNNEWREAASKYDVAIHLDMDEFVISDIKSRSLIECITDFYESEATFARVCGYECLLSLDRQIRDSDNIVELATQGFPYTNFDKPCILKPSKFTAWNLGILGRHEWSPIGECKEWIRHPIMKHIRGANMDLLLEKKREINEQGFIQPFVYRYENFKKTMLTNQKNKHDFVYIISILHDYLNNPIPTNAYLQHQYDIARYMPKEAKILEIGAGFGTISILINSILTNKKNHIVVEPNEKMWEALRKNKEITNSNFHIFEGALSSSDVILCNPLEAVERAIFRIGISQAPHIPRFTYQEIIEKYEFEPDTLVMDCEGAFIEIFRDFPEILDHVTQIFIHWDAKYLPNDRMYRRLIIQKGFYERKEGMYSVYEKKILYLK